MTARRADPAPGRRQTPPPRGHDADAAQDLTLVALLATAAAPAAAQVRASLDVGAGSYRADGSLSSAVASLAPSLRLDAGPLRFDAAGVYTDAPAGRWNFQGTSRLVLRSPRLAFVRAELAGTADWTSPPPRGRHHRARRGRQSLPASHGRHVTVGGSLAWAGVVARAADAGAPQRGRRLSRARRLEVGRDAGEHVVRLAR